MFNKFFCISASVLLGVPLLSSVAQANDADVQAALSEARSLYAQRYSDPRALTKALSVLCSAERKAENDNLNYDVFAMESQILYWRGCHEADHATKLRDFEEGIA